MIPSIPRSLLLACIASGACAMASSQALAQDGDESSRTSALIQTAKQRPAGKDRDEWREERRDAVRELGSSGDTRAVPVLIQIVKTEQFDAVGEIAIVALGKLGDERAIPILQEVAKDSSRDRFVRKAARSSLSKLGAKAGKGGNEESSEASLASTGLSGYSVGNSGTTTVGLAQDFGDDILAASDSLTFAVGQSHLGYDTVTKEANLDAKATSRYLRIREAKAMALRYEGRGSVVAGIVNYEGDDSSARLLSTNAAGTAEARFYNQSGQWFGLGSASGLMGFDYLRIKRPGGGAITNNKFFSAELGVALGGGYGRAIDFGEALRVQRIENLLRERKILGRAIGPDLAERIMRAWWQLRNETGYHDRLVATVAQLREAGVLLGEPDSGASYAILQVLMDGQLNHRLKGLQVHLAVGESFLMRPDDLNLEEGRVETILSRLHFGRQSESGESELRVEAQARYRILAEDTEASPWSLLAQSHWRDYHYGDNADPLGALDIGVEGGASNDGLTDSKMATRLAGSLGWLWSPSRSSQFRLAGELRYESAEMFLGVLFEGQYGLIDAGYVGAGGHL